MVIKSFGQVGGYGVPPMPIELHIGRAHKGIVELTFVVMDGLHRRVATVQVPKDAWKACWEDIIGQEIANTLQEVV